MTIKTIARIFSACLPLICISISLPTWEDNAFAANSPWMLGDWDGERTRLQQQGYHVDFGYTGEAATKLDGGYNNRNASRYADQFVIGSALDLNKILGWQDTEAQITITERNGHNLSNKADGYIGDPRSGQLSSVQEVWGRGQTWRLTDFWIKKQFLDHTLDIKVGRFGEGEDFNSFDCDFQNLSLCGSQVGNWAGDIWFNWPVSQWAARLKYNLKPDLFAQVGVYEHNDENLQRSKGFNLSTDGSDGAIIPLEMVWQPSLTADQLSGEYRIGYYHSSADSQQIKHAGGIDNKQGVWLVAKQQLSIQAVNHNRGLSGFVNLTFHDKKTNAVDQFQNIGLVYKGWFDDRPQDDIGIGIARIHVNDDVRDQQAFNNIGLSSSNPNYQPLQNTEYNAELYYGLHATHWLTLRPNIQWVKHPGGVNHIDDTWLAGLKLQTVF